MRRRQQALGQSNAYRHTGQARRQAKSDVQTVRGQKEKTKTQKSQALAARESRLVCYSYWPRLRPREVAFAISGTGIVFIIF